MQELTDIRSLVFKIGAALDPASHAQALQDLDTILDRASAIEARTIASATDLNYKAQQVIDLERQLHAVEAEMASLVSTDFDSVFANSLLKAQAKMAENLLLVQQAIARLGAVVESEASDG